MKTANQRLRTHVIRVGFIALMVAVTGRLFYVQQADGFIGKTYEPEWNGTQTITPMRGTIYDSNGDQLAFDMPAYNIDLDLVTLQSQTAAVKARLAAGMAQILQVSQSAVDAKLSQTVTPQTPWVRWDIGMVPVTLPQERALVQLFQSLSLSTAINPSKTYKRMYPDGSFASEMIGFVNQSGVGEAGTELEYNSVLTGKPGIMRYRQDAMGNPIPYKPIMVQPVRNGDSVYLTLDRSIQYYAEEAMAQIEKRYTPARAAIIVSNPNTGAILAMATIPDYNPNDYWNYPSTALNTNWAISDPFEPGSTFKIVTLTGALATHAISLNQTYMSGVDYVNGVPIHDWNWWGWGRITYREAMIQSSNTGFIHIGQAEGAPTMGKYIHLYGMDRPTGIDLPGEATSIGTAQSIFDNPNFNSVDFATTTFGQGLAVTPIQQDAEVNAVANGGTLYTPYVVQKIVSPAGKVIMDRTPHAVRQVASPEIMREITNVMVQDINDDPMLKAYIPGYQLAGKTGTANIPDPKTGTYYKNRYNLSFVGFVPADHPVLAIYVTVNEPHHAIQYGNDVSSPAAKFVLQKSLQYLRVPPQGKSIGSPYVSVPTKAYAAVPDVTGLSIAAARQALARAGFTETATASTGTVTEQWPAAGLSASQGTQVVLASSASRGTAAGMVRVPDLRHMPMIEAVSACSILGIALDPTGAGYAVTQSIPVGKEVAIGTVLHATFAPPGVSTSKLH